MVIATARPADSTARPMPRLGGLDHTLALLADPYRFISRHCSSLGSDAFEARLLAAPTICLSGPEAAELFYDGHHFQRVGAAPEPLKATLFGKGAVQGLDDEPHRRRKSLFIPLRSPDRLSALEHQVRRHWEAAIDAWSSRGRFPFYGALHPVLTRAACEWVGIPLPEADVGKRSIQLRRLFDAAAAFPVGHLAARGARWQAERWLAQWISDCRQREAAPPGSLAALVMEHRDGEGRLLTPRIAAVELLNMLRPTVAVSVSITFVARSTIPMRRAASRSARTLSGIVDIASWIVPSGLRRSCETMPMSCRSNMERSCRASSASLRAVMSMPVPRKRTVLPLESKKDWPLAATHRMRPSAARVRYSTS